MKIGNKISIIFTLITSSLLLAILLFVYIFSMEYTVRDFYQRLTERANIVGESYLEKDELSEKAYNEVYKKHWQILPHEKEVLLKVDTLSRRVLSRDSAGLFPGVFLTEIFSKRIAREKTEQFCSVGILYNDNQGDYIVVVSAEDIYGKAKMNNLRFILIISFLAGIIAVYLIGRFYAVRILKPISAIAKGADKISLSNLHLRLDTGNNKDELAELAITFNKMLGRLESDFQIQTDFINNASHELRNPLTAIIGQTEVALNKMRSAEEYHETLHIIENEAERLDQLVDSLLKLAQVETENHDILMEPVRIDELLSEVKKSIDISNPANQIVLDYSGLPAKNGMPVIDCHRSLMHSALTNLTDNACKYSNNNTVVIKVTISKQLVFVSIIDRGIGIPESDIGEVMEPFYRASNARSFKGVGVGLSLAKQIIRQHGGTLQLKSVVKEGTEATVSLSIHSDTITSNRLQAPYKG